MLSERELHSRYEVSLEQYVTKLNIVLEQNAQMNPFGFPFGNPPAIQPAAVEIKSNNAKLQIALKNLLSSQGLTYVILENSLLITTEDQAVTKQMTQRINVKISDVPLQKALKDLMRGTPVNLVLDPRIVKDAQNAVSLDVEGVTVETAVRLLAEMGGLKSVRVDNVLFVTNEARAEKMRQEQPPLQPAPANRQQFPNMFGGPGIGIGIAPAPPPAVRPPAVVPPAPPPQK